MNWNHVPEKNRSLYSGQRFPDDPGGHLFRWSRLSGRTQPVCHSETGAMRVKVPIISHSKPGTAASVVAKFKADPDICDTGFGCSPEDVPQIGSAKQRRVF
jgi:hypothetical protein